MGNDKVRAERRSKGLCRCGQPPREGKLSCARCGKSSNTHEKRKAAGMCACCGKTAVTGGVNCEQCKGKARQRREAGATSFHRWRAAGLCSACGAVPQPGRRLCDGCLQTRNDYTRQRCASARAQGFCNKCGKQADKGRITCAECLEGQKRRRAERLACGKCPVCSDGNLTDHHSLCNVCWDRNAATGRRNRRAAREEVLKHYGKRCECCGETAVEFLTIDHINGGGNKHRRELGNRGGYRFYLWLIRNNYPDGYRVLCFNCNCAIAFSGACPHQRKREEQCKVDY